MVGPGIPSERGPTILRQWIHWEQGPCPLLKGCPHLGGWHWNVLQLQYQLFCVSLVVDYHSEFTFEATVAMCQFTVKYGLALFGRSKALIERCYLKFINDDVGDKIACYNRCVVRKYSTSSREPWLLEQVPMLASFYSLSGSPESRGDSKSKLKFHCCPLWDMVT